jgi:alkylhydroperoxidase family enzyme
MHYHKALGQKAGLSVAQINDLGRFEHSDAYSSQEKDVLRFAEQWTRHGKVSTDVIERLKTSLSPAHLVMLAATVSQANLTSRFNNTFEIELP